MVRTPQEWLAAGDLFAAYLAACVAKGTITREEAQQLATSREKRREQWRARETSRWAQVRCGAGMTQGGG